jgi:Glycosyl transferases group 1
VNYRFSVVGDGSDRSQLKQKLSLLNKKIDFLGYLDSSAIEKQIYPNHTILLITSPAETGPIVAWEAMSHGLVLVTSQYIGSGLEGSLRDGENCLMFPVGDVKAAAEAIVRLQDPVLRLSLSQAGRELVSQRYSLSSSIQAWETAIKEILKLPPLKSSGIQNLVSPSGRLDLLLGTRLAEKIRKVLGISFKHQSAGGEWPHSYGVNADKEAFMDCLKGLENIAHQAKL